MSLRVYRFRKGGLRTCHRTVALESQHVVLACTGTHQVEAALAAGSREVADILEGRADRSPAVRIRVITLHLYCVQGGACGGCLRWGGDGQWGLGIGEGPEIAGSGFSKVTGMALEPQEGKVNEGAK